MALTENVVVVDAGAMGSIYASKFFEMDESFFPGLFWDIPDLQQGAGCPRWKTRDASRRAEERRLRRMNFTSQGGATEGNKADGALMVIRGGMNLPLSCIAKSCIVFYRS